MPRIMVVNDTQEILDMFRDLLEQEGYEVILYSYAIQDMDEILRQQPDLLILDYIFGSERTGWQLLQKLKMRRDTAAIPVVICTAAKRQVEEIEGHLVAMGVGIVLKPFNVDDLLRTVRQMLDLHANPHVTLAAQGKGEVESASDSLDIER
ncbi:MAG: response regulator transcription factor [Chloroflexi bacterium]|nr:response regulator transcription factor [Chloroflexota bacterium]